MERRLVLVAAALVIVPTFAATAIIVRLTRQAVAHEHLADTDTLAQVVAAGLAGHVRPDRLDPRGQALVQAASADHRVAAVVVLNPNEQVLHRQVLDPLGWSAFLEQVLGGTVTLHTDRPVFLPEAELYAARKVPIWNPPLGAHRRDGQAPARELLGFVILIYENPALPAMKRHLEMTQVAVASGICLLGLPVVVVGVRQLLRPIRQLIRATSHLGISGEAQLVPEGRHDELGILACSYNLMARRLTSARQDLIEANQQLEQRVEQRTAELADANARLQAEIDDKNEFMRAVTHDLSAPLRNISGMASLLLLKYKADLADDAATKLERITANARLQADLIHELLQLSRLRTRPGKKERIDLQQLLQELREQLSFDLEKQQITLRVQGPFPVLHADRLRIRQVFQNLLDNAVKYMLDGPQREIVVRYEPDAHCHRFHVQDTGSGIAEQDLPHVFQVFRRAVHSGSHRVPGRGIGLASVKSILESYGGQISVKSALGAGSTFTFTLSRRLVDEPATRIEPAPATA